MNTAAKPSSALIKKRMDESALGLFYHLDLNTNNLQLSVVTTLDGKHNFKNNF